MKYLSVASGVSAETLAWRPLGWSPVAFAQHDPEHDYGRGPDFASAVLAHHYPLVPNLGDMNGFEEWPDYADVDVLSGGTPCQSYSVAGLGEGLDDPRGDLSLVYAAIARRYRPGWVVWENVRGVLSNDGGRAFATILGLLSGRRVEVPPGGWKSAGVVPGIERAYGLAWRVLDSQHVRVDGFGRAVPQRRRRVFVVGRLGDWRRAAAVLFEPEGLRGNPPPRRRPGQVVSGPITRSFGVRGGVDEGERGTLIPQPFAATLTAGRNATGGNRFPGMTADDAAAALIPIAFKASHFTRGKDGAPSEVSYPLSADADKVDQDQLVCAPIAFDCKAGGSNVGFAVGEVPGTLRGDGHGGGHAAVAFQNRFRGDDGRGYEREPLVSEGVCGTLDTVKPWIMARAWSVRRLMPVECERLQGVPDGFTDIPWGRRNGPSPDGLRYRVLGNMQSVNVMRWIGVRIQMVANLEKDLV